MGKRILKKSRHIRWNWRESPESSEDKRKTRYFFDNVDDKFREEKIKRVLGYVNSLTTINFSFEQIGVDLEGKVENTKFRYLCKVYDSDCAPNLIQKALTKVFGNSVVNDPNLYERIKGKNLLEKYLESIHS